MLKLFIQMSSEQKRIVFSNECPNDQGSIIPNDTFDFSRYKLNPVILRSHDWESFAIGLMTDIKFENNQWSGLPVFHKITEESKIAAEMYEKGFLRSSSVGGQAVWAKEQMTGDYKKDDNGMMTCEKFLIYEISLPTLPSNPEAVTEDAILEAEKVNLSVIFKNEEANKIHENIITLKSKIESQTITEMAEEKVEKETAAVIPAAVAEKSQEQPAAQPDVDKSNHVVLATKKESTGLPKWLDNLIGMTAKFAHPEGEYGDTPIVEAPKKDIATQEKPTGLSAEAEAKAKKAEEAVRKVKEAKAKYDDAEDEEEKSKFKVAYDKAKEEAESACKEAADYEATEETSKKASEVKEKKEAEEKPKAEESKNNAHMTVKPIKKTQEELAGLNLAAAPGTQRISFGENVSFSKLQAETRKGEGEGSRVMNRIFNGTNDGKSLDDYKMVLNSILSDPKYRAIIEKTRFHMSANDGGMNVLRQGLLSADPRVAARTGIDFKEVSARLNSNRIDGINFRTGQSETRTTLSTAGDFSSLDTIAVEWLPLIIYKLFPSESWKNDIPVFGVQQTARNYGIIWTNITADPAIYRGTQPTTPADYTNDDTAVGLSLTPYFLQPMRWTPYHMAQLRYDQQASGWAQGLMKLEAKVGDDLLYTLGAGALANSQPVIKTGGPIDNTQPSSFTVGTGSNGADSFYFNPAFNGTLTKPGFNDILRLEQFFKQKNFDLNAERPILVLDPVMDSYISQDKQTQSLLTRWINESGAEVQKIKHTSLFERSRVLAYDPAGNTMIDTNADGVIVPTTTQSAGLSLVSSQVGIGLGQIDVFFVQDPTNYGFKMSMDMRIGTRALRSDYTGVQVYSYGTPVQAGA